MAQKSGFFNALNIEGEYDRKYNANDYSDNLAVIIGNGVLRSTADDLKVTASGMVVTVAPGRGWINGHYYMNDTPFSFSAVTAPIGGSRYDRIMLRCSKEVSDRSIELVYVEGIVSNNPVKPSPTRTGTVYDLVLADIYVATNATSLVVTDTRQDKTICGWVYSVSGDDSFFQSLDASFYDWFNATKGTLSSVTLFKRYTQQETLESSTSTIAIDIPQYDPDTCFLEVFVNGIFDSRHQVEDGNVYFIGTLVAGTVVTINCYKSIDGTGIMTVADEITELQNAVSQLDGVSRFTYKCNGVNDNVVISEIVSAIVAGQYNPQAVTTSARAFLENLGGDDWLSDLTADAKITIEVSGDFSASAAFSGSGTDVSPYRWISFGTNPSGYIDNRVVTLDFSKCTEQYFMCTGNTANTIFFGSNVNIKNANVSAFHHTDNSTNIQMIDCYGNGMNAVNCEDCYFQINTSGTARIADHGTFTNCKCKITSENAAAYCFKPKSSTFIRLIGGSFLAYCKTSSGIGSAIAHTSASEADAVLMAYNIHCPVITVENYSQGFLAVANAGKTYINGVVSRLTSSGSYHEIIGLINKNKV